jgi:ATP-binding cassette, subfamily B, bacterial
MHIETLGLACYAPEMAETEKGAPNRKLGNLRVVWGFAMNYPGHIAAAVFFLIISSSATSAIPLGFRQVVDQGFSKGGSINTWFGVLFALVMSLALATALRFYFVSWLGERVIADIRTAVVNNLVRMSPSYFDDNRPAEIASRLTADTSIIEQIVGTTVSMALRNLLTGIVSIFVLMWLSPKLAGMILLGIPLVIGPIIFFGRRLDKLSRSTQDRIASVGVIVNEVLGAMKIVQAFGQERREAERFSFAVEATFATARRRIRTRSILTATVITLIFGSITLVLLEGAHDVRDGIMSGGTIAAFVIASGIAAASFGSLSEIYGDLVRGSGAAGRLAELLREEPGIAAPPHPVALPEPAQGRVSFENVSFHYPTRPDTSALAGLTLEIKPGETVAVVGPSGAGKTTLFQLIQRFYDPESGTISVDGVNLRDADPGAVRARIAMVPQETVIFAASARDNLRYGHWEASDKALWAAADAANASEFLRKLPEGLDTYMGEGGARLSGGQRQRMAIARAILRDAPILLLDEATSALDAESERLVQDALDKLMHQRTTIVIAHRLATVRAADRIIVLRDGKIVEQGNHTSLTQSGGLYARLARMQFDGLAA